MKRITLGIGIVPTVVSAMLTATTVASFQDAATPGVSGGRGVSAASPERPRPAGSAEAIELLQRVRGALGGDALDRVYGVRATMRVGRGERAPEHDEDPTIIAVACRPAREGQAFAATIRQSGGGRVESEIGFDGRRGWMSDGTGGVMALDAEQARTMLAGADLQALLREIDARFDRFDLDPPSEFRGRRSLVLRAVRDDDPPGSFARIHVDPSTALPLAIESFEAAVDSAEPRPFSTAIFERWERLGELRVFRRMTSERERVTMVIEFDEIEYGPLPEATFASPLATDPVETPAAP